jgi:hypothetical protein
VPTGAPAVVESFCLKIRATFLALRTCDHRRCQRRLCPRCDAQCATTRQKAQHAQGLPIMHVRLRRRACSGHHDATPGPARTVSESSTAAGVAVVPRYVAPGWRAWKWKAWTVETACSNARCAAGCRCVGGVRTEHAAPRSGPFRY